MSCPHCHVQEGFFHDKYCRESTPFSNPRFVIVAPVVCLPLMTRPTREAEKGTKYLPEVWKPNG